MDSAQILSAFERCPRIPYWGREWKRRKLKPVEMIEAGVRAALTEHTRSDYGELAGEEVYSLGIEPGIDSEQYDQHAEVVHLAALADVVVSAIRKPGGEPWIPAPDLPHWKSGCYRSPDSRFLRRVLFTTSWNDDRHYAACRNWDVLGEVCIHGLPMQLLVVNLGQHRDGKYHSYWSHALLHPSGQKMPRFRKRNKIEEGFKGSWVEVWRERRDDIDTKTWLQGMLDDGVLQDLLLKIEVPVPKAEHRQRIVDLARRKLEIIGDTKELPMQQLSTCDWPSVCWHRAHCHAQQEPSQAYGLIRITG